MEEQSTLPLLQKEYHLDCPGCDYDRKRDLQEGLPYKEFSYIWMICLAADKRLACCRKNRRYRVLCRICGLVLISC